MPSRVERYELGVTALNTVAPLLTLSTPEVRADPYPYYSALRRLAPIVRDPSGAWVVTRYADIRLLLEHPDTTSARVASFRALRPDSDHPAISKAFDILERMLVYLDPPAHGTLRHHIQPAFTAPRIRRLATTVERIVDSLLAQAWGKPDIDVIRELAGPLPIRVIGDMFGAPRTDYDSIEAWSRDAGMLTGGGVTLSHADAVRFAKSVVEYEEYFLALIRERARRPGDDLLSTLVGADSHGGALGHEQAAANAMFLVGAGHMTTTHLIANGVVALSRNPDIVQRLRDSPELWPTAIDELLRYDSPVQLIGRGVSRAIDLGPERLAAGDLVYLAVGSGNRDADQFVSPDSLALDRVRGRHLGFGLGIHYCMGAGLARLEAAIALRRLLERTHALYVPLHELEWQGNPTFRGLTRLPLQTSGSS